MFIERPPRFFRALVPDGHFRMPQEPGERSLYLTFDDGPIPQVTPWVLDLLDGYGIKATFFMVGDNARRYPELVAEVRSRGHRVGNHTMHHLQGVKSTTRTYLRDVCEAQAHISPEGSENQDKPLFRPPHGWLRPRQARALKQKYRIIMYDLVSRDYSKKLDADMVLHNVMRYARPGSIVVFHDSLKSLPRLQSALPRALEWLMTQGYTFKLL